MDPDDAMADVASPAEVKRPQQHVNDSMPPPCTPPMSSSMLISPSSGLVQHPMIPKRRGRKKKTEQYLETIAVATGQPLPPGAATVAPIKKRTKRPFYAPSEEAGTPDKPLYKEIHASIGHFVGMGDGMRRTYTVHEPFGVYNAQGQLQLPKKATRPCRLCKLPAEDFPGPPASRIVAYNQASGRPTFDGQFCTVRCVKRFELERSVVDTPMRLMWLSNHAKRFFGQNGDEPPAPPTSLLKENGGHLTPKEYYARSALFSDVVHEAPFITHLMITQSQAVNPAAVVAAAAGDQKSLEIKQHVGASGMPSMEMFSVCGLRRPLPLPQQQAAATISLSTIVTVPPPISAAAARTLATDVTMAPAAAPSSAALPPLQSSSQQQQEMKRATDLFASFVAKQKDAPTPDPPLPIKKRKNAAAAAAAGTVASSAQVESSAARKVHKDAGGSSDSNTNMPPPASKAPKAKTTPSFAIATVKKHSGAATIPPPSPPSPQITPTPPAVGRPTLATAATNTDKTTTPPLAAAPKPAASFLSRFGKPK